MEKIRITIGIICLVLLAIPGLCCGQMRNLVLPEIGQPGYRSDRFAEGWLLEEMEQERERRQEVEIGELEREVGELRMEMRRERRNRRGEDE